MWSEVCIYHMNQMVVTFFLLAFRLVCLVFSAQCWLDNCPLSGGASCLSCMAASVLIPVPLPRPSFRDSSAIYVNMYCNKNTFQRICIFMYKLASYHFNLTSLAIPQNLYSVPRNIFFSN